MAFSLRLPLELDREARMRASQVGVTLNGFICVALDAYLRGLASDPVRVSVAPVQPLKPNTDTPASPVVKTPPIAPPTPLQGISKALPSVKGGSNAGSDFLLHPPGVNASKAERRAFTEKQRLLRKGK